MIIIIIIIMMIIKIIIIIMIIMIIIIMIIIIIKIIGIYKLLAPSKHIGFEANLSKRAVRRNCSQKPDESD